MDINAIYILLYKEFFRHFLIGSLKCNGDIRFINPLLF
jgi:hypothetical protein